MSQPTAPESSQDTDDSATPGAGAGAVSEPSGDGPITLKDRIEPGGQGSPDTNQAKAEPMAATPDHPEPLAVPELADMNVGAGDPQAPSRPETPRPAPAGSYAGGDAGREPTHLSGPGADADAAPPGVDPTTSTGRAKGPEKPVQQSTGTAHKATGMQGETPEGESVEDDLEAGATRMGTNPPDAVPGVSSGHGDAKSVPASGDGPAPGSSETQPKVEGARLPVDDS